MFDSRLAKESSNLNSEYENFIYFYSNDILKDYLLN